MKTNDKLLLLLLVAGPLAFTGYVVYLLVRYGNETDDSWDKFGGC